MPSTSTPADYSSRECAPGVTLHVNRSARLKTNRICLYWVGNLGPDVTERALVSGILTRATRSHPDIRSCARHLEQLYGASLTSDVLKVGEFHVLKFRLEFVNDAYLQEGEAILRPALEFLAEVVGDPRLEEGCFPAQTTAQEKENQRRLIESLFNDKGSYAAQRCLEEMCRDEEFRRYPYGRVEDLEAIGPESLTRCWRTSHDRAPTHVFFSGDVEESAVESALEPLWSQRKASPLSLQTVTPLREAGEPRGVNETLEVNQSKLVLGYRTATRYGDPLHPAAVVANGVLGSFPHSKLFQNVREKASLCYYASSSLEQAHGLLFIHSGIEAARRDQAQELIQQQIQDLQEGVVREDEIESTRRALDNRLLMLEDNPGALMDTILAWSLHGQSFSLDRYRKSLLAVGRDEIVEAARRWRPDTFYFLSPEGES